MVIPRNPIVVVARGLSTAVLFDRTGIYKKFVTIREIQSLVILAERDSVNGIISMNEVDTFILVIAFISIIL